MPFERKLNAAKMCLYVRGISQLTMDDFKAQIQQTVSDPDLDPTLSHLVDMRKARFKPTFDDAAEISGIIKDLRHSFRGKIAVVTNNDEICQTGKLVSRWATFDSVMLQVFLTVEDAEKWIAEGT